MPNNLLLGGGLASDSASLGGTLELLGAVLALLALLPGHLLLLGMASADEAVAGLESLEGSHVVVDKGEAVRIATTELGAEANEDDLGGVNLVHLGDLLGELSLGDVGAAVVDDVNKHLLPLEEAIDGDLAGADGSFLLSGHDIR